MKKLTAILAVLIVASVSAAASAEVNVKSGISYSQQWGLYIANIVENDGKITNVIIDRLANGKSSKELHDNYGIKPVSSLNKDWWEQVAYYENWVVEHGLEALETDEKGHALNLDLISGATINVAELSQAVKNAMDGSTEDSGYMIKTGTSYSKVWGLYIANVIFKNGEIIKILLDRISNNGEDSKEKYDNYGIKKVSSINKDWWEQVAYYEDWVLEHGIDAVKYGKDGKAENVDLISGATIGINDLTLAVLDALKVKTAPDVITLSYSDHEPLGNMRTKFLNDVLFPAIEKESNGRIKIAPHWNGELSISYKALLTVQEAKDAQIAVVVPEYFMDALPLHQVFKSFPVGPTGQEQVNFFRSIYEKIPALKDEIEKQNLHVIFVATGFPAAFFSHEPLNDLSSIKNQKWRSASFWHKDFLSNAGAIPVTMPWGNKVFEALADGSLDGLIVNIDSGYDIKAHTEAKYVAVSPKLWLGHAYLIAMNKDVWNSLSEKEQEAFEKAADFAYAQLGAVMDAALPTQIKVLRADDAEVRILSDKEVSEWEEITKYKDIQDKWLQEKIGAGIIKTPEVLEETRKLIGRD